LLSFRLHIEIRREYYVAYDQEISFYHSASIDIYYLAGVFSEKQPDDHIQLSYRQSGYFTINSTVYFAEYWGDIRCFSLAAKDYWFEA
jgi:hypothetical protein